MIVASRFYGPYMCDYGVWAFCKIPGKIICCVGNQDKIILVLIQAISVF